MSIYDSPNVGANASNASSSRFESPSIDTLKRKGKRRTVNLVNPASMDDWSHSSSIMSSSPLPRGTSSSPLNVPASGSSPVSTSPMTAPPARFLRETTPVDQISRPGEVGSEEVLNTPKETPGSKMTGHSVLGVSSGDMANSRGPGDYGAVKGILRLQGTPGSGNGVRFGQKNRFRVITPNNSMSTYGTPPRPAPIAPAPIATPPPVASPRTSFFSSLLSVVPISSPLRTSFGRPSFASPAALPAPAATAVDAGAEDSMEGQEGESGQEEGMTEEADQSWEVPGEEGEVSLLGSSTGEMTRSMDEIDEQGEEEGDELELPAMPWSGVPEVHSSPLSLPSGTGDTSKDISVQDLVPPNLASSASGSGPTLRNGSLTRGTALGASPLSSPHFGRPISPASPPLDASRQQGQDSQPAQPRRGRYSSGLHTHARTSSTDSATLFAHRPAATSSFSNRPDSPGGAEGDKDAMGDVSNLLSTTFDGMYNSCGMSSGFGTPVRMSLHGGEAGHAVVMGDSPVPQSQASQQEWNEDEGDSSFGLLPRADDDPTIRRRLSASGGLTARYDFPAAVDGRVDEGTHASNVGAPAGRLQESSGARRTREEFNPFAPSAVARRSPIKDCSSPVKRSESPSKSWQEAEVSVSGETSRSIAPPASSTVEERRARARSRSRSASPVKRDVTAEPIFHRGRASMSPGASSSNIIHPAAPPPVAPATSSSAAEQLLPAAGSDLSLLAAPTPSPPSSDKKSKFSSIFADMSAEQAGLHWPLQASTGNRVGVAAANTTISPLSSSGSARAAEKTPPVSLALTPAAVSPAGAAAGDASSGSMSMSPLMIKSIRHGTDATTLSPLPPAGAATSGNRQARTPLRMLTPGTGGLTGKSTGGDGPAEKTAFFTPSSTPCPPREVVPFSDSPASSAEAGAVDVVQSQGGALLDLNAIIADLNLSGPSLDLLQAHDSHSTALEQQVDLFRTLAARLAEEVEERDRALAGVKVKLVKSEMRAVRAEDEMKHRGAEQESRKESQDRQEGNRADEDYHALQAAVVEQENKRRRVQDELEAERADARVREHGARQREADLQAELRVTREQLELLERHSPVRVGGSAASTDEPASSTLAQQTIREQDDRIRDLEIRLRMSQEDVDRERRERQKGMDRAESLEARAVQLEKTKRDLQRQASERGELVEEWRAQVDEWKDRCEASEVELADARDRLDAATDDIEGWKMKVQEVQEGMEEGKRAEQQMGKELERERVASADLERIANELKIALAAAQQEAKRLRAESASKDLEITQLVRRKGELKEDREMLNIALDSKQQEVELLKRKLTRASKSAALPRSSTVGTASKVTDPDMATSTTTAALGESHRTNLTSVEATPMPAPIPAHARAVIARQYDSVKPSTATRHAVRGAAAGARVPDFPETPSVAPGRGASAVGRQLYGSTQLKDRVLRRGTEGEGGRGSIRAMEGRGRESVPA